MEMSKRARPTDNFACTRGLKNSLITGCQHPEILREIIRQADRLAFTPVDDRPAAINAFKAFCASVQTGVGPEGSCLLWQPEDDRIRHVVVRDYRRGESVVSVSRAMWACVHVVSQQGPQLGAEEELHLVCRQNGRANTGWGACLNPAHFIRGDEQTRHELKQARELLDRIYSRMAS
jgi:hypothetical protein